MSYGIYPLWALILLSSATLAASKQASVQIQTELLPSCTAGTVDQNNQVQFGTLDFGRHFALDNVITVVGQSGAGAVRLTCVEGLPFRVLISPGQSGNSAARELSGPTSATVRYNLFTDATYTQVWDEVTGVTGAGTGTDQWLAVYGRVPAQPTPVAGVYTDTLTVTVIW